MELIKVESSMIQAVGYDAEAQMLEVVFNSGKSYRYTGVPPTVYNELLAASSKGQYMQAHILDFYPVSRVMRRRRQR
ncbi:KTSC domain-containing protein [Chloroflexia bacterium SDU3-3]|nr:KTSC domain-containing protein [Chloroflexia bacterium SDU3-3]